MDRELWQQLQPMMDEALALSVDDRRPWMERVRLESPTIADELERLLAREGTLDRRGFLDSPLTLGRDVAAALTGESAADRLPRLREALTGRYGLEERVGQGGMAEVYGASDVRHGRRVAVKVIRPDASSVLGAERFLSEIRLTAKLTHPNILPLLDSGEVDGVLFYVMPFIEGESLRARMRREGALPVPDVLRVLRAVAEALAYAHEAGTVHRDIKPDNILMSGRQAWVADFGIAKAMASSASSHHSATSVGVALGSPGYMAPEQIEGAERVDARADLYSLGVVAWEMLAGRPLFEGKTLQQLFLQHLTVEAPAVDTVRAGLPAGLSDVIARLLVKAPEGRTGSASALLTELEALGSVSGAHPPLRRPSAMRWAWVGAGVMATAAGVLWMTLRQGPAWPGLPERLSSSGDMASAILSPDGRRIVYRRRTNPSAIWAREVADTGAGRVLVSEMMPGPWAWVDDTTVAVSQRDTLALVHAGTGVIARPGWVRAHRLASAGPGAVYNVEGRPTGPGRVVYRRILASGWGDSLVVSLDSGESIGRLLRHPEEDAFVAIARTRDSAVRVLRVSRDGRTEVLRTVSARDSSGVRLGLLANDAVPFLSPSGDRLHVRLRPDSMARIALNRPEGSIDRMAFPAGSYAPPSVDGSLLLRSNERGGKTWRFPVSDDMALRGQVIDEVSEDTHDAALSPDGKLLAQVEGLPGQPNVLSIRSLETGTSRRVLTVSATIVTMVWSPDGNRIALRTHTPGMSQRLAVLDVRDGRLVTLGRPSIKAGAPHIDGGFLPAWTNDSRHLLAQDFAHDHGPGFSEFTGVTPDAIVRRYTLTEGDTGVAIHTHLVSRFRQLAAGEVDTLWINGMKVSPDGKSVVVGGQSITIIPFDGSAPRRVVEPDTTVSWMYPLSWRNDGRIAYATRSTRVGNAGNVFRTFSVASTGGATRPSGAVPPNCVSINVLESRDEASCFEPVIRSDMFLLRGPR